MITFLYKYILWHYTAGLVALFDHVENGAAFLLHYFSPSALITTLFSPWSRLHEAYASGIHLKQQAGVFAVNTIMRLVGAVVRLAVLALGIITFCFYLLAVVAVFLLWVLLPLAIFTLFGFVFNIFFS